MELGARFRVSGIQIASHILEHGRISREDFYHISGSKNHGDELLSMNIFTTVPRSEWVFFDTKPMEIAVRALVENSSDKTTALRFLEARK